MPAGESEISKRPASRPRWPPPPPPLITSSPGLLLPLLLLCGYSAAELFPINPHIPLEGSPPPPGSPWPLPKEVETSPYLYTFDPPSFPIFVGAASDMADCPVYAENVERRGRQLLFPHGLEATPKPGVPGIQYITFEKLESTSGAAWCSEWPYLDETKEAESYEISTFDVVGNVEGGISIKSYSVWGALYAVVTLSQLIWVDGGHYVLNSTQVKDSPRFPHRGLLLDTARHFIPVEDIFLALDGMFWNKLNVFHWHLTDDQSFPYESSAFPNLSAKGAYSPDMVYTQDDVRQVVEYSRNRGIRVIPEFDAPGHTYSFGKAMPDILTPCYGDGETPGTPNYPLHAERETMNPMLDSTYAFLRTFFEEVVSTFPDTFVHLGMDEVNYNCWKSSPEIAAFMQDNGMTEYAEVEQYFVERHSETIAELGARQIVWQDPLEKGVEFPDGTVVQIWKWESEVQGWTPWQDYMSMSTALGYQSLLSSCWYLNMISYGEQWISYYECDPHDFEGTQEQKGLVLGGEGALWMEYIDPTNIHPLLWPRASAIAERLWSSADVRDIPAARYRLDEQRCRLLGRGIPAAPVFNGYCPKITVGGLNSPMTNSTIINEDFRKRA